MIYFRAQRPPFLEIPVYLGHVVSIWTNQLSHQWNVPRDLLRFPNRPVHCEDTSLTSGSCYHSLESLSSWTQGDQREASPRRSRIGYKDGFQQKQITPPSPTCAKRFRRRLKGHLSCLQRTQGRHRQPDSGMYGSIIPISFFFFIIDRHSFCWMCAGAAGLQLTEAELLDYGCAASLTADIQSLCSRCNIDENLSFPEKHSTSQLGKRRSKKKPQQQLKPVLLSDPKHPSGVKSNVLD